MFMHLLIVIAIAWWCNDLVLSGGWLTENVSVKVLGFAVCYCLFY